AFLQEIYFDEYKLFQKTLSKDLNAVSSIILITGIIGIIIGLFIAIQVTNSISSSIKKLNELANDVTSGKLGKIAQLKGKDEFADLGNSLNEMSLSLNESSKDKKVQLQRIKSSKLKLEQINKSLFNEIETRKKVEKQIQELRAEELNTLQNKLIHSEKMVSLGNLIAGIAHEINTPLGAIKASIEGILDNNSFIQELMIILSTLSENEIDLFLKMVNHSTKKTLILSSKEERIARKEFTKDLITLKIPDPEYIADIMVDLQLMGHTKDYKKLLLHNKRVDIFDTAHSITGLHRNGKTIKLAVDKAAKIIFALKSYAHFDENKQFKDTNLIESIDNILTLYTNQLKQGIELVKNFEDVPLISCVPDQLGQIWTNLISNSIHAMDGQGTLTISVLNRQKTIIIKIADDGEGTQMT
ncbi:MAG: HAMP domain-containing protein, partial [Vicingaceae bacterium]|nr:HAMP domain-containing protein [Vicingaceae bacterium]